MAQTVRIGLQCRRLGFSLWVGKIPLEEEMAAHSSILAWKIPWQRNLVGYSPWGFKETDMTEWLTHPLIRKKYRFSLFVVLMCCKVAWDTYSTIDVPRVYTHIYTCTHTYVLNRFFFYSFHCILFFNFIEVYLTYNIVCIIQIEILNPKMILADYSLFNFQKRHETQKC